MRTPSTHCRHGHKMSGVNLLWHTRYKDGEKYMVRECRTCAYEREKQKRRAVRRNRDLEQEALAAAKEVA